MNILMNLIAVAFCLQAAGICLGSWQNKLPWLLLPAAAYGISGIASVVFQSWWPLFIGFSLARLCGTLRVGLEPQLPNRTSAVVGFYVNHIMQIGAGIVGANVFLGSSEGWMSVVLFTTLVQGLDTVGIYHTYKKIVPTEHSYAITEGLKRTGQPLPKYSPHQELLIKIGNIFVMKLLWYCLITMVTAMVVRKFI